jgi:hypothetical protein
MTRLPHTHPNYRKRDMHWFTAQIEYNALMPSGTTKAVPPLNDNTILDSKNKDHIVELQSPPLNDNMILDLKLKPSK